MKKIIFTSILLTFGLSTTDLRHAHADDNDRGQTIDWKPLAQVLSKSIFTDSKKQPQIPGLDSSYDPLLMTIGSSLSSRHPRRTDDWRNLELPAGNEKPSCKGALQAHFRRSSTNSQRTIVILPGSHASFARGGFVNQTAAVLDKIFDKPNIIAFSGFQSPDFLKGRCFEMLWDPLALGSDMYRRIEVLADKELIPMQQAGVVGFSGGGTIALGLLAEDSKNISGGRRKSLLFPQGAIAFSPILHGRHTFELLDREHSNSRIHPEEGLLTWKRFGTLLKVLLPLAGPSLENRLNKENADPLAETKVLASVRSQDADEFKDRVYNEFTVGFLKKSMKATGIPASVIKEKLSYRGAYFELGFKQNNEKLFDQQTDIQTALYKIKAPTLIYFSQDDPILSAAPGDAQPKIIEEILDFAKAQPNIKVFNPPYGGHTGAVLDPIFQDLLKTFFKLEVQKIRGPTSVNDKSLLRLSDSYDLARKDFLRLSKTNEGQIASHPLQIQAPQGWETLHIDSSFFPAKFQSTNLVILVSGQHGVEAPAGSALQRLILDQYLGEKLDRENTSYLLIHAMNPFGFKYGRRFNPNNVDLNRNCFNAMTDEAFPGIGIRNPYYESARYLLENELSGSFHALLKIFRNNGIYSISAFANVVKAVLLGQYHYPKGLYFGGSQVEPECRLVQNIIAEKVKEAQNVLLINFHTGLGPAKINQIMTTPPHKDSGSDPEMDLAYAKEKQILRELFPKAECEGICTLKFGDEKSTLQKVFGKDGERLQGTLVQWAQNLFGDKRKTQTMIAVTSEIGTHSEIKVAVPLINENFNYWNTKNSPKHQKAIQSLREVFNPSDLSWRENVIKSGHQIAEALNRFAR